MSLYRTILLVDDDAEDRDIFVEALHEVAPSVHCLPASDGEMALGLLMGDTLALPDILFIDLNMPRMNGKQVLQEIKKRSPLKDIPIIMYSTFFGEQDIQEIMATGAAHYMIKPTRFDDLRSALSYILTTPW